jgi:hypothetical protein
VTSPTRQKLLILAAVLAAAAGSPAAAAGQGIDLSDLIDVSQLTPDTGDEADDAALAADETSGDEPSVADVCAELSQPADDASLRAAVDGDGSDDSGTDDTPVDEEIDCPEDAAVATRAPASGGSVQAALTAGAVSAGTVAMPGPGTVDEVAELVLRNAKATRRGAPKTRTRVGHTVERLTKAGTVQLVVELSPAGKRAIRRVKGRVKLSVRATLKPDGGAKRVVTRAVVLKRSR